MTAKKRSVARPPQKALADQVGERPIVADSRHPAPDIIREAVRMPVKAEVVAAAAKAAATALLTNQIVQTIHFDTPERAGQTFRIEKCVLEQDGALCAVIDADGTSQTAGIEVLVRVSWSIGAEEAAQDGVPVLASFYLSAADLRGDWADSGADGGSIALATVKHSTQDTALDAIPAALLVSAVQEVLATVPANRTKQGVRVVAMLGTVAPRLPVLEVVPNLSERRKAEIGTIIRRAATEGRPVALVLALGIHAGEDARLVLDETTTAFAPMLAETIEPIGLGYPLEMEYALHECARYLELRHIVIAGAVLDLFVATEALAALALPGKKRVDEGVGMAYDGNVGDLIGEQLAALATREKADPYTVRALRDVVDARSLMHVARARGAGWLYDSIARRAAQVSRSFITRSVKLEAMVFGPSGTVLGRAELEASDFSL